MRFDIVWSCVGMLALTACATDGKVGTGNQDAGHAARGFDECGNGLDDDGDGRIDEAPCSCGVGETQPCWPGDRGARVRGQCADGIQVCMAEGSAEFGTWGACTGAATHESETCEGAQDEDCDGAIDEGCECSAGETRSCVGSAIGTCRPGTQRCNGNQWTGCEDAIEPVIETCGNALDDDCDGVVDNPRRCACTPEPELCDNGSDDDCDGDTDEAPCTMDSVSCTPTDESCDGDDDCDGTLDEGACTNCACEQWTATWRPANFAEDIDGFTYRGRRWEVAFDGEETFAFLYPTRTSSQSTVSLTLIRLDGSVVSAPRVLATRPYHIFLLAGEITWTGDRFVATWTEERALPEASVHAIAVDRNGVVLAGSVRVASGTIQGAAGFGTDTYLVYFAGGETFARRLDDMLGARGAPIPLPRFARVQAVEVVDGALIVVGDHSGAARLALLRDGALFARSGSDEDRRESSIDCERRRDCARMHQRPCRADLLPFRAPLGRYVHGATASCCDQRG